MHPNTEMPMFIFQTNLEWCMHVPVAIGIRMAELLWVKAMRHDMHNICFETKPKLNIRYSSSSTSSSFCLFLLLHFLSWPYTNSDIPFYCKRMSKYAKVGEQHLDGEWEWECDER